MLQRLLRPILKAWPRSAWYAGRLGNTVSVNGFRLTMPSRLLAGVLRMGGFEIAERQAVRFLPTDLPLVEFGCGVGVVACIANRRLKYPERHLCIDANPDALALAARNGRDNGCGFSTLHAALAYDQPTVSFAADPSIVSGAIEGQFGEMITVPTTTLGAVLEQKSWSGPISIVCDIEGAELDLLEREVELFRERVDTAIFELHPDCYGEAGRRRIMDRLRSAGLAERWSRDGVVVWQAARQR